MSTDLSEPLLSIEEVAAFCGVAVETVRWWRKTGRGPRSFRLEGRVRFAPADVRRWVETQQTPA